MFLIIMRRRILEMFFECRGYNQDRILHDKKYSIQSNTIIIIYQIQPSHVH